MKRIALPKRKFLDAEEVCVSYVINIPQVTWCCAEILVNTSFALMDLRRLSNYLDTITEEIKPCVETATEDSRDFTFICILSFYSHCRLSPRRTISDVWRSTTSNSPLFAQESSSGFTEGVEHIPRWNIFARVGS
jgi:hypothetical protein